MVAVDGGAYPTPAELVTLAARTLGAHYAVEVCDPPLCGLFHLIGVHEGHETLLVVVALATGGRGGEKGELLPALRQSLFLRRWLNCPDHAVEVWAHSRTKRGSGGSFVRRQVRPEDLDLRPDAAGTPEEW
jgi:hypothetical protein